MVKYIILTPALPQNLAVFWSLQFAFYKYFSSAYLSKLENNKSFINLLISSVILNQLLSLSTSFGIIQIRLPVSDGLSTDQQGPPKKKQKLGGTIDDMLVPVDPIKAVKVFLPGLVFKTSGYTHRSQVHTVSQPTERRFTRASIPIIIKPKRKHAPRLLMPSSSTLTTKIYQQMQSRLGVARES